MNRPTFSLTCSGWSEVLARIRASGRRFLRSLSASSTCVLVELGGQRDARTAQVQVRAALHLGIAGAMDQGERANHLADPSGRLAMGTGRAFHHRGGAAE